MTINIVINDANRLIQPAKCYGGRKGIRTLDTLKGHTRFPSVRLKPLGHPSACAKIAYLLLMFNTIYSNTIACYL